MNQFLETILSILSIIVILSVLVSIHEAGHLAMAKAFHVYCFDYSIGFGPALIHKKRKNGETYFSLRAIPFGGFVSMYGEEGAVPEGFEEPAPERSLNRIAKWKKCIVLVAGVTLNFALGLVLLFISDSCFPQYFYAYGGIHGSQMGAVYDTATYEGQSLTYLESRLADGASIDNVNVSLLYVGEGRFVVDSDVVVYDASNNVKGEYVATISVEDASSSKELTKALSFYEIDTKNLPSYSQIGAGINHLPDLEKGEVLIDSSFNGCHFSLSPYFTYYSESIDEKKDGYPYYFQYATTRPEEGVLNVDILSGNFSSIGIKLKDMHTVSEGNAFAISSSSQLNFHRPVYSGEAKTKLEAILPAGRDASEYALSFYTAGGNVSILDDEVYLHRADGSLYSEKRFVALFYSAETARDHSLASAVRLYPVSSDPVPTTEMAYFSAYPDVANADNFFSFDSTTSGVYFDLNARLIHMPADAEKESFYPAFVNESVFVGDAIRLTCKDGSLQDEGITIPSISSYRTFDEAWKQWCEDVPYCCSAIVKGFASLFTPQGIQNVSGIVGMTAALPGINAAGGVGYVFFFAALISINLAFFNLLPFPGLDGYQLILTIIEGITRKEVPQKIGGIISFVGLAILILFMVFITVKDIIGLL